MIENFVDKFTKLEPFPIRRNHIFGIGDRVLFGFGHQSHGNHRRRSGRNGRGGCGGCLGGRSHRVRLRMVVSQCGFVRRRAK